MDAVFCVCAVDIFAAQGASFLKITTQIFQHRGSRELKIYIFILFDLCNVDMV